MALNISLSKGEQMIELLEKFIEGMEPLHMKCVT